jgi:uncharacterized membrane protein YbhN (UPF0104 family)
MASSEPTIRVVRATRLETGGVEALPTEFTPRRLLRRFLQVLALLTILVLVAVLAPGLGEVRDKLGAANPGWLAIGVALEAASCWSYVVMFRPVFCSRMSWRTSCEIAWAELGAGSIVPASGAGGLALGAWILHRGGMPGDRIARRSVAFFLLKSSVNFAAVVVIGGLMAVGLVGPHVSPFLTAVPAVLAALVIVGVLALPKLGPGGPVEPGASKLRRGTLVARRALIGGTAEAVVILRSRDLVVLGGALGYWLFDNAVLWATYRAVGAHVPVSIVLMGYLIGQLGGLLPLPGGVGGIDGGLIGTLVVYGAPAAPTAAAVLAYRVILFWLPLIGGAIAFAALRRALAENERPDLCQVVPAV